MEQVARIPLSEYFPYRSYGIVLRRGKFLSPQAKRFLEIMNQIFVAPQPEYAPKDSEGTSGYEDF
jgi:hypothetical protein